MAAIANGGTLYRPQIVEKIQPVDGDPLLVFRPEATGTLPLRKENLDILREALTMVTRKSSAVPPITICAACNLMWPARPAPQNQAMASHMPGLQVIPMNAENTGLPDIAIAVIVENIGEGSEYAVPIFRAMVETYYYGSPQFVPWFGQIGEPLPTPTPFGGGSPTEEYRINI